MQEGGHYVPPPHQPSMKKSPSGLGLKVNSHSFIQEIHNLDAVVSQQWHREEYVKRQIEKILLAIDKPQAALPAYT